MTDTIVYTNTYLENKAQYSGLSYVEVQTIDEKDPIFRETLNGIVTLLCLRGVIAKDETLLKVSVEPGIPGNKEAAMHAEAIRKTLDRCITAGNAQKSVLILDATGLDEHKVLFATYPIGFQGALRAYNPQRVTVVFACGKMSDGSKRSVNGTAKTGSIMDRFWDFGGC